MSPASLELPEALEAAATALPDHADAIRPANGDPAQLLRSLSAGAAAAVLGWLLEHQPEAGAQLADEWAEDPEAGAAALLALAEDSLSKTARKILRRVRHQLRSRGVSVPEAAPPAVVSKLPPIEDALTGAQVSAIDPTGTRLVYLVEPHPGGGARLFELMLDEGRGVVELEVYATGRSKVRRFLRDLERRAGFRTAAAPPDAVRALVARIVDQAPEGRPLPRGFREWRSHVASAADGQTPGDLAREALGAPADGEPIDTERCARVVERIERGDLGPWPPAADRLEKLFEQIAEIGRGRIIVSGVRRKEQVRQMLDEAIGDVFGGEFSIRTAQRYEESAYLDWQDGRAEEARDCLAAAHAFRGTPLAENPVARAMLERVLAPALERIEDEPDQDEASSLIVKP
jgi:hypothetical protein